MGNHLEAYTSKSWQSGLLHRTYNPEKAKTLPRVEIPHSPLGSCKRASHLGLSLRVNMRRSFGFDHLTVTPEINPPDRVAQVGQVVRKRGGGIRSAELGP